MRYYEGDGVTPPMEIYSIADLIKDKVVCDVGAGNGAWAKEMRNFAKEVTEIEIGPEFTKEPKDFMDEDLNGFEVLYFYMSAKGAKALAKKLIKDNYHGVVISCGDPLPKIKLSEKRGDFLIYKL